ncbi:MAG: arylesterase [Moraxellaceae bacterium]|jgi:hypothetical protein|nr:arylesterase [Moraxellaceae bacterium]
MRKPCQIIPFLLFLCLLLPAAGMALPASDVRLDTDACTRISTGPGPHSLLPLPGSERLLISSHDRRAFAKPGALLEYDVRRSLLRTLPRRGEPQDLVLRPHHMDVSTQDGEKRLYVINHDEDSPNSDRHSILVYRIEPDQLVFRKRLADKLLSSPNHLSVAPDGDIYVSNDRRDGKSVMELVMRRKHANLVHYREGKGWQVVVDGLSFPNGVKAEDERVFAVMTFGNALLSWPRYEDGRLGPRQSVVTLPALDGLNPGPDPNTWLTVSHGPLLDFLRHKRSSDHRSPATVFLVNVDTKSFTPFFADDGRRISAMSNAVLLGQALYIGQSFDAFILRCPLKTRQAER